MKRSENDATQFPVIGPYPRQFGEIELSALLKTHFAFPLDPSLALQVLVTVLHHAGHLSEALLANIAHATGINLPDLRALCSFYSFLHQPTPCRYRILVSTNVIDNQYGAQATLAFLQSHYQGQTDIVIAATACTGFSDLAPGALINGIPVTRFTVEQAKRVVALIDQGIGMASWPQDLFNYQSRVYVRDFLLNMQFSPGDAIKAANTLSTEQVLDQLKRSGLRGRGGAGFPTWQKWQTAAETNLQQKYVVCNADEGEPGTFKDRYLLENHFGALIEGMWICGHAIGATQGFIYLRGEYAWLHDTLQRQLANYRQNGLLGDTSHFGNPVSSTSAQTGFDIQIHIGAGAYICGEESALIESLEGKRGIPRIRPPFPAQSGFRNKPTVVNNVETFCAVTWIQLNSADAFAAIGTETSRGTKLHSVSGDCEKPGIYEFPMGTTVAQLLALCDARNTQAVQVGGPSGRLLFPEAFDTAIDFAHVSSGGSFMVFSEQRKILDILRNFAHFFAHESCGFCTPCRAGTQNIAHMLDRIEVQSVHPNVQRDLQELAQLLHVTSHCGLGQTAASALSDYMQQRPQEFSRLCNSDTLPVFLRAKP